jgi:AcrR family transcriptional regulator
MPASGRASSEGATPKRLTTTRNRRAGAGSVPRERKPPSGVNGAAREFGRERVIEIQRTRLLAALFEVSAERGAGNVAVAHIVERAGVSRRTFYELFADREQCFLAGFDDAVARASRYVLADYDPGARWVERLRAALTGLLSFLDVERGAGQLLIVGSLGAGPRVLERRRQVLAQIIAVVDEGRGETKNGPELPPLTAEGVVGGVLSVLHSWLLACPCVGARPSAAMGAPSGGEPGDDSLQELTGPLMSMIVLPYLGSSAARRQFARPAPERRTAAPAATGDPLRDVGMRLTYRTVRVLQSVAANPGSSNREVGAGAGIDDQGQISKLLARLQRLELIQNTRSASARGAPNTWGLTERGWNVQRATAGQNPRG